MAMKKYELVVGNHFGHDDDGRLKEFTVGDVIELDDDQAKSFADKVKPYVEVAKLGPTPKVQAPTQQNKDDDKK